MLYAALTPPLRVPLHLFSPLPSLLSSEVAVGVGGAGRGKAREEEGGRRGWRGREQ
jgi:hypothetical protein